MNLVSDRAFGWILTALVCGGTLWALLDLAKLWRARGRDGRDPLVRDARFGYATGIVIGTIALIGVLRYNGVV